MNNPRDDLNHSQRYSLFAIIIHWTTVVLLISLSASGWYMSDLPNGAEGQEFLYQLHKSLGITVLLLTVARIVWRLMNPPPALPDSLSRLEKLVASGVHLGFYVLLIAIPISGWIYVSTARDFQVPTVLFGLISWPHLPFSETADVTSIHEGAESVHSALVWMTVSLLFLHVAGAIKHQFADEDGVLSRMLSVKESPLKLRRVAIATAFPVVILAAVPLSSNLLNSTSPSKVSYTELPLGNWIVDYDQSEIRFSGMHDGSEFSGRFEKWSTHIQFDENALDDSVAVVKLFADSAKTGSALYDNSLKSAEWFDIANNPVIMVYLGGFLGYKDGYASQVIVHLKDTKVRALLPFTLALDGPNAVMIGQTTLDRNSLNLGQVSDPDNEWVSNEIKVDIKVVAKQNPLKE